MRANPGAGPLSLAGIVSRLGGRVSGDDATVVYQVASLENAAGGEIAFFSNPRYLAKLKVTAAGAVVVPPDAENLTSLPRIVTDNPYAYFARLSLLLNPEAGVVPGRHASASIDPTACIAPSAQVGPGAAIGANTSIGARSVVGAGACVGDGAQIGEDCRVYPRVVIYPGCVIGSRVILHSGAVIGADGFGIAKEQGRWLKIPQIGSVILGDDVEIGANTTIDRGAIDDTVIEEGVKLDNQIQIGHNCRVGAHTAMAGCVAVAGSAKIGRACTFGAGAIVLGHLSIADDVHVSAATVISHSVHKPGTYTGMFPFDDNASWAKNTALVRHLSKLADRVKALERRLSDKEGKDG